MLEGAQGEMSGFLRSAATVVDGNEEQSNAQQWK